MENSSTEHATILEFRRDIEAQFRLHIREALDVSLREELAIALGSARHERTDERRGYRHGTTERTLTTAEGKRTVTVPRGRVVADDGTSRSFAAGCCRGMPGGRGRSMRRSSAVTWVGSTRAGSRRRSNRCGARRICRRARSLGWSDV